MFANKAKWSGYKGVDEQKLRTFGRSRLVYFKVPEDSESFSTFVWEDFKFDEQGNRISYDNFMDCLNEALIPGELFLLKGGADAAEFF
mmetsp:Transcript_24616/g.38250  ORF Transcript_24616/g.38250 Transcript_24616/m.38250 type:complete len:88 (-) Transcript_24616:282-545(-)